MKFNVNEEVRRAIGDPVQTGDVFAAYGNKPTVAWVVVNVRNNRVVMLGIDGDGEVCSAQTYGAHAFESRPVIGRCSGIEEMRLDVEWTGDPRRFK